MIYQTYKIREGYSDATLTDYVCDNADELKMPPRPAVVVCPGGGYHNLSSREGEPIVRKFFDAGMNVYLLKYSLPPAKMLYNPLIEAALAIKYIRDNAALHNTNPEKVFICGFSAGGHLAASSGILWNIPEVRDAIGVTDGSAPEGINRPNGMILSYPVISAGEFAHKGSFRNLCENQEPSKEELDRFSLELHVDTTTPPAFIWHTVNDQVVPVQNSLLLINALTENGIPFEAHIFPYGPHGLALANYETFSQQGKFLNSHVEVWADLAVKWTRII